MPFDMVRKRLSPYFCLNRDCEKNKEYIKSIYTIQLAPVELYLSLVTPIRYSFMKICDINS